MTWARGGARVDTKEFNLRIITAFGGKKCPFVIVNNLLARSALNQLIAETKIPIHVSRWANKTAQSAMTNWIFSSVWDKWRSFEVIWVSQFVVTKKRKSRRKTATVTQAKDHPVPHDMIYVNWPTWCTRAAVQVWMNFSVTLWDSGLSRPCSVLWKQM